MTTDRMFKTLLVLICVSLWGILLRPLFIPGVAQAQAGSASDEAQRPTILQAQPGTAYLVVSGGQLSVWYVDVPGISQDKTYKTVQDMVKDQQDTMKNTRLIRADVQSLPTR